ncbi:MAG: type III-B CRISPR module RAMP protein Cmr4, partial [Chloroflexi bacterium]|nr:type III-B CRISPR module RAMP protein Cmr4 [Chloroflexota bacterium]
MTYQPQTYRYFLLTLDPVHIGTGGARLGRVDNPIVREPGTRLPKIPGSSLHGMIRAYAAYRYGKPQCAGQGKNHCAQPTCPICYTFGHARDKAGGRAGVVAISDARILLFPVYSMVGPVWVTSPGALYDAGFRPKEKNKARFEVDKNEEGKAKWPNTLSSQDHLNLGWLMVERDKNGSEWEPREIFTEKDIPDPIRDRVVLVSDKLFSQIVNSNLEVRTSVAINPHTGAAEEGALFTYEAIPRATVLWMDVVVSDYRGAFPASDKVNKWWQQIKGDWEHGDIPEEYPQEKEEAITRALPVLASAGFRIPKSIPSTDKARKSFWKSFREALLALQTDASRYQETGLPWKAPRDVLDSGLEWAEHLGVGGMGTRG